MSDRKAIDCRDHPSESGCTLRLEGKEDEVLAAAVNHAITTHGHADNPELREQIRGLLKDAE
jgi:predicted small metal-binding protein